MSLYADVHETATGYCMHSGITPAGADLNRVAEGRIQAIPLGVECSFPRDGGGAPIVVEPRWNLTYEVSWSLGLIGSATVMFLLVFRHPAHAEARRLSL